MSLRLLATLLLGGGLLVGSSWSGHAQNLPFSFNKPAAAAFDATTFAADTGAAAVVLGDFGRTWFTRTPEGGFKLYYERTRQVKVLREAGFEEATVRIPLYHRDGMREEITTLKATTWNPAPTPGGAPVRTDAKAGDATDVRVTDYVNERRLPLPAVRVGSVIEYRYVMASDFLFQLPTWWFQEELPVRWSEYRVELPAYFDYAVQMQGYAPLKVNESTTDRSLTLSGDGQPVPVLHFRWAVENQPAFRPEAFITTPDDYRLHVGFQLRATRLPGQGFRNVAATWRALSGELLLQARFGGVLGSVGELAKPLGQLKQQFATDTLARAAAVVALVRQSLAYNGHEGVLTTGPMRAALDRKQGNAAEVNLLLVSALRVAGLATEPVLVSTRDHGTVPDDEPIIDRFNFVLALLLMPGHPTPVLLDATSPDAAFGMLPENCLNTRGRVITNVEADQRWVAVSSPHQYTTFKTGTLKLDERGTGHLTMHTEFSGYSAQMLRRQAHELGAERVATRHSAPGPDARLVSHHLNQPPDLAQPVSLDVELASEGEAAAPAQLFVSLKNFGGTTENPFRQPHRQYPVDLGAPLSETVMLEVQLPAGYVVESVPKPAVARTTDGSVRFQFSCTPAPDGRSVQLTSGLRLSRALYAPEAYEALRGIYQQLVAKHAEALVLKKQI